MSEVTFQYRNKQIAVPIPEAPKECLYDNYNKTYRLVISNYGEPISNQLAKLFHFLDIHLPNGYVDNITLNSSNGSIHFPYAYVTKHIHKTIQSYDLEINEKDIIGV